MKRALYMVWLAAAAGCVQEAASGEPPVLHRCNIEFTCSTGDVCGEDGKCYGNVSELDTLAIEVVPASDDPVLVRQEFIDLNVATSLTVMNGALTVQMQKAFVISGSVRMGGPAGAPIPARVVARRASRIPGGAEFVVEATASANAGYTMRVPPGEVWQIIVYPKEGEQSLEGPPVPFALLVGSDLRKDFIVPAPGELKKARGVVVDAVGDPVIDVPVQVFGRLSAVSGEVVASQSVRTAGDGSFQIALPVRLHSEYRLVINGQQAMPLMPEVSFPGVIIPDPTDITTVKDLGRFSLPAYGAAKDYSFEVQGVSIAGSLAKALGARVSFTTEWAESAPGVPAPCQAGARCSKFKREAIVDPSGRVTVALLPGNAQADRSYLVDVLTPATSAFASQAGITRAVPDQGGVIPGITLDPKTRLTGKVADLFGAPLQGVEVVARPALDGVRLNAAETLALAAFASPRALSDGSDGSFAVLVEPRLLDSAARYDIELVPPPETGLPRWLRKSVVVGDDQTIVDLMTLTPPEPVLVAGTVEGPDGRPVEHVEVLIFRVDPACTREPVGGTPTCVPPRLLARTETYAARKLGSKTGNFTVILSRSGL